MPFGERLVLEAEGDRRGDRCLLKYGLLELDDGNWALSSLFFGELVFCGTGSAVCGVCCSA